MGSWSGRALIRPAGFRTHTLVCVGSALVMSLSQAIPGADPARLGAQVVSGVGFLGAGSILREGFTVRGLTTAASLWVVATIGLACGAGFSRGWPYCYIGGNCPWPVVALGELGSFYQTGTKGCAVEFRR